MENWRTSLVAPCGLDCSRCVACGEGEVAKHAKQIQAVLGENFQPYADRLKSFVSPMENYKEFRTLLDHFAAPSCGGCRSDVRSCLPDCKVAGCVTEKQIAFCFECESFPNCDSTGLPEFLQERWRVNNQRMQEIGVEAFILEKRAQPRYP